MQGKGVSRSLGLNRNGFVFAASESKGWQGDIRVTQHGQQVQGEFLPPKARVVAHPSSAIMCQMVVVARAILGRRWVYVT